MLRTIRAALTASLLLWTAVGQAAAATDPRSLVDALAGDAPLRAAEALLAWDSDAAAVVLQTLVEGQLYRRRADGRVVAARREGAGYAISDPLRGEALGEAGRRDLRRLRLGGAQRDALRLLLARAALTAPDPARRLDAVNSSLLDPSAETLAAVRERLPEEANGDVASAMRTLLALDDLRGSDGAAALAAVPVLARRSDAELRGVLDTIAIDESRPRELREAAARAVDVMASRAQRNAHLQTLFFGLSLGSVLALAAVGLAISFGVMGVINMAHGEFIMLGAYTTWLVQQALPGHVGLALLLALPAAFLVTALVGIALERGVIRHLYGRPLETLLATFGISLILQQAVRSLFSPLNRAVVSPAWMSGTVSPLNGLELTVGRLYILLFCLTLFVALWALLRYTRVGLQLRAVAQNRDMARCLGVATARIDALTFGLGAGLAGLAGVALSQLTNVGPNLGQSYIIDSFMVVVTGGVGNLWGTLAAGLSLGVLNKALEPVAGTVLAKILILVGVILFIQWRPGGLFPQRGRAAQS